MCMHCLQEAYSHVQRGKNFMHMTFSCIVQFTFSMLLHDSRRISLHASIHRRHFVSTHHSIRHFHFSSIGISITTPAFPIAFSLYSFQSGAFVFFRYCLFSPNRNATKILVVVVCLFCCVTKCIRDRLGWISIDMDSLAHQSVLAFSTMLDGRTTMVKCKKSLIYILTDNLQ